MYLLDSNIYINFYDRYYRKDFFPTFWSNFAGILNSSVVIPKIVVSENYQDEWFRDWLSNNYTKSIIDHKSYVVEWSAIIQFFAYSVMAVCFCLGFIAGRFR